MTSWFADRSKEGLAFRVLMVACLILFLLNLYLLLRVVFRVDVSPDAPWFVGLGAAFVLIPEGLCLWAARGTKHAFTVVLIVVNVIGWELFVVSPFAFGRLTLNPEATSAYRLSISLIGLPLLMLLSLVAQLLSQLKERDQRLESSDADTSGVATTHSPTVSS